MLGGLQSRDPSTNLSDSRLDLVDGVFENIPHFHAYPISGGRERPVQDVDRVDKTILQELVEDDQAELRIPTPKGRDGVEYRKSSRGTLGEFADQSEIPAIRAKMNEILEADILKTWECCLPFQDVEEM